MALNKKANENYIVYIGRYSDRFTLATTESFETAKELRDEQNNKADRPSDMIAEIETVRHYPKGAKVS
jgi:hypothetical protein